MAIASVRILETNPPQIEVTNTDGLRATSVVTEAQIESLLVDCAVILTRLAVKRGR